MPIPASRQWVKVSRSQNGAALYPDSVIPWEIKAAAREAMEESLE